VAGALAVCGWLGCLRRRHLVLILWLPAIYLISARGAGNWSTAPLAMLIGVGVVDVAQILRRLGAWMTIGLAHGHPPVAWLLRPGVVEGSVVVGLLGLLVVGSAILPARATARTHEAHLEALTFDEYEAMRWVATHTPADATFIVLSARGAWWWDYVAEWFPTLAQRKSLLTVQGTEWLPRGTFARRERLSAEAQRIRTLAEWQAWTRRQELDFTWVYISKGSHGPLDWQPLLAELRAATDHQIRFENGGAAIIRRGAA
jgi:hypothetical protein